MRFKLQPGTLSVSDIQDDERGRLANIEIAILRKIGTFKHDATVDRATAMHFSEDRTPAVREVLRSFLGEV
jgi:hypothetical protein